MLSLIIKVLACVLIIAVVGFNFNSIVYTIKKIDKENVNTKKLKAGVIAVGIALFVILFCTTTVPSGSTGVRVTFGAVAEEGLDNGLKFKLPFIQRVVIINNQVVRTDVDAYSASKDLQQIHSTISVNYRVSPESSVSIYKNIGKDHENKIVRPAIQEASKATTARYTAEELIASRDKVSMEMCTEIQNKLSDYGLIVQDVNIIDFDFSDEFNKAIEEKQTAQQKALKAEQDLARIKVEAEQKVATAKAEAEAYELKNRTITDKVIQMEFLEKWDGKMPSVMSDGNMMFDITQAIK